jgi:RNA polymerase sigma-70 factor, ECF subfamily
MQEKVVEGEAADQTALPRPSSGREPGGSARRGHLPPSTSRAADGGALLARAIARAKAGDASALHFLYVRYADGVQGYVESIVRDRHEAEDITQDVFAKLLSAIARYEQREVPFAAWLQRVARNAALDHLRGRRQIPFAEVRTSDEGHEQLGFERSRALRAALEGLPEDQREVLVLRHVAGLSPGEIALLLGRSEAAVHGLHHRGRASLRVALSDLDAAPVTGRTAVPVPPPGVEAATRRARNGATRPSP